MLRVERERQRLGQPRPSTYHAYKDMLDADLLQQLEYVRLTKRTAAPLNGINNPRVGWEDVVMLARDRSAGVAFSQPAQAAPPARAPAPPVSAAAPPVRPAPAARPPARAGNVG